MNTLHSMPVHRNRWLPTPGNVLLVLLAMSLMWATSPRATAREIRTEPQVISTVSGGVMTYQASLTFSDGTPINAPISMIFRLYDARTGGTLVWEEQWPEVQVYDGMVDVLLGTHTPIPPSSAAAPSLFLGVSIGTDPEMSPRLQIGMVPIAQLALGVADQAITRAKIVDGAIDGAKIAHSAVSSVHITNSTIVGEDLAASGFGPSNRGLTNFIPIPKTSIPAEDLTNVGSRDWASWDLSGIVPPGTTAVLIYGYAGDVNGDQAFSEIRFNGFATTNPHEGMYAIVPQGPQSGVYQGIVSLDHTRRLYYKITASGSNTFSTGWKVLGYWEPAQR